MENNKFTIIIKTLSGLENILAKEMRSIDASDIEIKRRAVFCKGDKKTLYLANLNLRTAMSVLKPISFFRAKNDKTLYKIIRDIEWTKYFDVKDTFSIDPVISSDYFKHSQYAAQKTKDAIVDQFREEKGIRPSVNKDEPTVKLNLHIVQDRGTISLDSSGAPLYKRGYRNSNNPAPINEVLAAGMILLSGWDHNSILIDPMCGSGTMLIEAAMIGIKRAPNILRKKFGLMNWKNFDKSMWDKIVKELKESEKSYCPRIVGSDVSTDAIITARKNIQNAGLSDYITTRVDNISEFIEPVEKGTVIINPPYGERLKSEELNSLYQEIGSALKHKFSGFTAWVISNNMEAFNHIGLRHSRNIKLFNGSLECKFRKYELYDGSKKKKKNNS